MPSSSRLTPLQIVGIAASTGVGWGIVMALVAWIRDGAEIVLLQGWILAAAWLFGHAAGRPRAGALAGLAVVAAAVWTYELLPGWGVEAAIAREALRPEQAAAIALEFDRNDIVLVSTMLVGAMIGFAGALQRPVAPRAAAAVAAPAPATAEAPAPPAPLWAGFQVPQPVAQDVAPQPSVPAAAAPMAPAEAPWAAAFLLAALATDFFLGRVFDMYTGPQDAVALVFLVIGIAAVAWLARRYALAMILAGAVLGSGFAAVQHAEYEERRPDVEAVR